MRVSVIIPTYNRAALACEAVESVLQQKEKADEIIVVDDGSTDVTVSRLHKFGDAVKIISKKNGGISSARNVGIHAATHEWIAFLDSDDLWKPQKLARQKRALNSNPDYNICYTDEEWRKNGVWFNPKKVHQKHGGWIYANCLPRCIISASSVMLHRRVFDQIGLFDESLPACEDYDLWLRIAARMPIHYIAEKLIIKRDGPWEQLSHQHSLDKYRITALAKILSSPDIGPHAQATYDMLVQKCDIFISGCEKHNNHKGALWAQRIRGKCSSRDE